MILLDEPSSGLDAAETEHFGHILTQVIRQRGRGILLVEHDMALVRQVCDQVWVLDFGQLIFQGRRPTDARERGCQSRLPRLRRGRSRRARVRSRPLPIAKQPTTLVTPDSDNDPCSATQRTSLPATAPTTVLWDINLEVPPSTVVALLGPNGAGKTTLLRAASGLIPVHQGRVIMDGEDATRRKMNQMARRGLCHIPEGRGFFPSLSVKDNLTLFSPLRKGHEGIEQAAAAFPILGQRLNRDRRQPLRRRAADASHRPGLHLRARIWSWSTRHPWAWPPSWSTASSSS